MQTICNHTISEDPKSIAMQQSFLFIIQRSLLSAAFFTTLFWILAFTINQPYRVLKEEDKKKRRMKFYLHIAYLLSYLHGPVVTIAGLYYLYQNGVAYACASNSNELWVIYVILNFSEF